MVIERDRDAGQQNLGVRQPGLFIFGEIDGDGVAQLSQGPGKRANNIGQAAGFCERDALRCGKDNVHRASVSTAGHGITA